MAPNERVIKSSADDRTLICRSTGCLQEPPTDGGYLCSNFISTYYIFTIYDSSMIQEWLNCDMILDRVTLKQGKTHCGSNSACCYGRGRWMRITTSR